MVDKKTMGAAALAALLATGSAAVVVAAYGQEGDAQHVSMQAMKFDFLPETVTVKKGKPVVLELTTLDRLHGFDAPSLGLHAEIAPGAPTIIRFTPDKAGKFGLHCDIFCGEDHEGMMGQIIVTE